MLVVIFSPHTTFTIDFLLYNCCLRLLTYPQRAIRTSEFLIFYSKSCFHLCVFYLKRFQHLSIKNKRRNLCQYENNPEVRRTNNDTLHTFSIKTVIPYTFLVLVIRSL
jgi:hypothetical protein